MPVRAKFVVNRIERSLGSYYDQETKEYVSREVQTIKMTPVAGVDGENAKFFAATPSGSIELGVVNADAAKGFDIGSAFYVDFTKVE